MPEDVLTLRRLNRATLARQLLLERKPLSPTAVIERLVGTWTRTTSFRREALERQLASAAARAAQRELREEAERLETFLAD